MSLEKPPIISLLQIDSLPANFKWEKESDKKFSNLLFTNNKLSAVVTKIGYKAAIGVAAALTEIIWWRLSDFPDIESFSSKNAVLWVAAIDPAYVKSYEFDYKIKYPDGISSPLSSNWYVIKFIVREYTKGSFYIQRYLMNLTMLTRHLMPNKKLFDDWFADTMRRTTETFPCPYDYATLNMDDAGARYDCSNDAPIPREFFFDPNFEYTEKNAAVVLNKFLKTLDYNSNPYLCSPEEMITKEFKGTPYTI